MRISSKPLLCMLSLTLFACSCKKNSDSSSSSTDNGPYFARIRTIIQNNCLSCHSSTGLWAGRPTAFDSDSSIAAQYASIKAAVYDSVTPVNKRMPENGTLSANDIDIIIKWYDKGGRISD